MNKVPGKADLRRNLDLMEQEVGRGMFHHPREPRGPDPSSEKRKSRNCQKKRNPFALRVTKQLGIIPRELLRGFYPG